jgi:glycosyltransferase involved in cell wall biosynthesis
LHVVITERETDEQQVRQPDSLHTISVVIPMFNEEGSIKILYQELTSVLEDLGTGYEIIFVNDGSTDSSGDIVDALVSGDTRVSALHFRRNFGKAAALAAGFKEARGDIVFTLDADLQDDPNEIPSFLKKIVEGFDLVSGWKYERHDPISKTLPSKLFNKVAASTTGVQLHDFNCGFKAYKREVVENLRLYGELHRYIPALAHHDGFKVTEIKVNHRPRQFGKSKYGIARFTRGLLDLLTVLFITRYTKKPLHLFGSLGLILLVPGFIINTYLLAIWLMGEGIARRPLLTLGVLLMIMGMQFISTGLLGEMITSSRGSDDPHTTRRGGS